MIPALKLHFDQLFLYFFLHINEFRLFALHRALSGLEVKFFKTFVVIPLFARFTLYWIDKYSLAKGTQVLWFELILSDQIGSVHDLRDVFGHYLYPYKL